MTTCQLEKLHILQHALGLDRYGHGASYRNHFVTGPGTTDWPHCQTLVADGLMATGPKNPMTGNDCCFFVTALGREYVATHSPKPQKLTRSQRRYRAFLNADSGLSFGEWIKTKRILE